MSTLLLVAALAGLLSIPALDLTPDHWLRIPARRAAARARRLLPRRGGTR